MDRSLSIDKADPFPPVNRTGPWPFKLFDKCCHPLPDDAEGSAPPRIRKEKGGTAQKTSVD